MAVVRSSEPPGPRMRRHEWISILGRAARTKRRSDRAVARRPRRPRRRHRALRGAVLADCSRARDRFRQTVCQVLLGTDNLGRDVLSRLLDGGWELLAMAAIGTVIGVVLGAVLGITAAYARGKADTLIMRTVDVILAFPGLVFILVLVSIAGPSGLAHHPCGRLRSRPARGQGAQVGDLDISERDFVRAAELQGEKSWTIMVREILPNLISPLMVESGLRLTYSILEIAGISFLGFGLPPPTPSWGQMINENRIGITPIRGPCWRLRSSSPSSPSARTRSPTPSPGWRSGGAQGRGRHRGAQPGGCRRRHRVPHPAEAE